jgi:hypothetical protein
MNNTIYCPYSDREVSFSETTTEHIIPLSLGGSDRFTIPVHKHANSQLGSQIDGKLADDFLILFQREKFRARGHSGQYPTPLVRKAKDAVTERPLQVTLGKELKIWDSIDRKYVPLNGQSLELSLTMKIDIPLQFVAKTALSAGYFVYGDLFKRHVRHQDLRVIMKGPNGLSETEIRNVKTKLFDRFQTGLYGSNKAEFELQKTLCEAVRGSCVAFIPGKNCLGVFVGVLGHYLGMVNIPADTKSFPRIDDHDLGHTIFLIDGVMKRRSYRARLQELYSALVIKE